MNSPPADPAAQDILLAQALGSVSESFVLTDSAGWIIYTNDAFSTLTGYEAAEVVGTNCRILQGPGTNPQTVGEIARALASGEPYGGEILNYTKAGTAFWNSLSITPLRDAAGRITHFVSIQRDMSDRAALETVSAARLREARRERETSGLLLEAARSLVTRQSTSDVVSTLCDVVYEVTGADRACIAIWNEEMGQLSIAEHRGWPEEMHPMLDAFRLTPEDSPEFRKLIQDGEMQFIDARTGSSWARGFLDRFSIASFMGIPIASSGRLHGTAMASWIDPGPEEAIAVVGDRFSGLASLAAVAIENARLLSQAQWQASHDVLTGLPNRDLLQNKLVSALQDGGDPSCHIAVLYVDIDRFKRTNEALGHEAGDAVLRHIALRLEAAVGPEDTVARFGGDEFVIVLPRVRARAEVEHVAARITSLLAEPLTLPSHTLYITASIGVAFSPHDRLEREPGALASELIHWADGDMLRTKSRSSAERPGLSIADALRLNADMRGAIERGEMTTLFQPQIDLGTGRIVAVEALARWRHPDLGVLSPTIFVPIAEENGLIHDLGRFVITEACALAARLQAEGTALEVAFNVSALQLTSPAFTDTVVELLERYAVPASLFIAEITESQAVAQLPLVRSQLVRLRNLGITVAVDDFGTGYSSLVQLSQIPATELKIDNGFTQSERLEGDRRLAAILGLGHGLGLRVVAEGVDTQQQLDRLRDLGFDRAQGYLIGRPVPADEIDASLRIR